MSDAYTTTEPPKPEYSPLPDPAAQQAPDTFKSDQTGVREAAKELSERREESTPPIPREYKHDGGYGEKVESEKTVTARRAARDLTNVRNTEAAHAVQQEAIETTLAVDQFRHQVATGQPAPQEAQPELQPQPEMTPQPESISPDNLDPDIKAALENPKVRAALEQHVGALEAGRQQYSQAVDGFLNTQRAMVLAQFPELHGVSAQAFPQVLQVIAARDPGRAQAIINHVKSVADASQVAIQYKQAEQQQVAAQQQNWMKQQDDVFDRFIEKAEPAETVKRVKAAAVDTLVNEYGVDRNELAQLWNTPLMRSAATQAILYDAIKFRMLQKNPPKPAAKPLPPVMRPGVASDRVDDDSAGAGVALKSFINDPNPRSAAKALAASRRNAARNAR